jgi:dienelactone hydrolase
MKIDVTPQHSLIDEKLDILASNLEPGQPVTVRARIEALDLESSAVFMPDAEGNVDLDRQAPVSGSYDWAHAMGLLWTLKPAGQKRIPFGGFGVSPEPLPVVFSAEQGDDTARTTVERAWMREGVQRFTVDEDGLHGVLFMPPGPGPFPGVITLTGSGGGTKERTAALLANHGYAALALAYFAYPGRPDYLLEIELEYFEKGLQWLGAKLQVDAGRLAVTGGSRGGELTLLLASTFPSVQAAVAYVPSHLRWGGFDASGSPEVPAWTYRGEALPYVRHQPEVDYDEVYKDAAIPLTPEFLSAMEKGSSVQEAVIEVEKAHGPILLISGDDDQMWPSALFSRKVMARLQEKQFPHPFEHLEYAGAGHAILIPYIPLPSSEIIHPVDDRLYALGGTPQAQAHAIEDSWQRALAFLDAYL